MAAPSWKVQVGLKEKSGACSHDDGNLSWKILDSQTSNRKPESCLSSNLQLCRALICWYFTVRNKELHLLQPTLHPWLPHTTRGSAEFFPPLYAELFFSAKCFPELSSKCSDEMTVNRVYTINNQYLFEVFTGIFYHTKNLVVFFS